MAGSRVYLEAVGKRLTLEVSGRGHQVIATELRALEVGWRRHHGAASDRQAPEVGRRWREVVAAEKSALEVNGRQQLNGGFWRSDEGSFE